MSKACANAAARSRLCSVSAMCGFSATVRPPIDNATPTATGFPAGLSAVAWWVDLPTSSQRNTV